MAHPLGIVVRHCVTCRTERMFEQPECLDDHGPDCPEWSCVECGEALVVGFEPIATELPRRSRGIA